MAADRHPFAPFAWKALQRAPTAAQRAELAAGLRGMLRFQRGLQGWPRLPGAPDATPFVSLYANGRLAGCQGSGEGRPTERVGRAFLRALHDGRFPPLLPAERGALAAQVSYVLRPRLVNPENAAEAIEIGLHGVGLVPDRGAPAMILPHAARDARFDPRGLLAALAHKAHLPESSLGAGALYVFESEDVVVHGPVADRRARPVGVDAAASWLASLVDAEGRVTFAVDPRARRRTSFGEMHHGRAAVVVQALDAHGRHGPRVARARRRLDHDIRQALGGASVDGWSDDPDRVAGTLALAVLAGVALDRELAELAASHQRRWSPWHAAQVVAALGPRAPSSLWAACVADLERRPFAPWTLMAADARGDRAVRERAGRAVADALRKDGPHRGGVVVTNLPETAVTALSVEALARHEAPWARAAVARGREFLGTMQLLGPRVTAGLDPAMAHGAFSANPALDWLRCDISAHAVLAMLAKALDA